MANPYTDLISGRRSFFETAMDEKKWLIDQLRHPNPRARWNAACMLGKLKYRESVPALIAALEDEDWLVRLHAAKALGRMDDRQAITPLQARLQDDCPYVRRQAKFSIGLIGIVYEPVRPTGPERAQPEQPPAALKRQLPPAFDLYRDETGEIRKAASWLAVYLGLLCIVLYNALGKERPQALVFSPLFIVLMAGKLKEIGEGISRQRKKRAWRKDALRVQVPLVDSLMELDDYAETEEAYRHCELVVKHSHPAVNSAFDQVIWAKVSYRMYQKVGGQALLWIDYDPQNPYSFVIEGE